MNTKKVILNDVDETVGVATFLGIRGVGEMTYQMGVQIDALLSKLSHPALESLARQLSQCMPVVKQVYAKIKGKESPEVVPKKIKNAADRFSKYSDYVKSVATLPVDFMQAVSTLNKEDGEKDNVFFYKNGQIICMLKKDEVPAHQAAQKCETIFKQRSIDVIVEEPKRIAKYAKKILHTDESIDTFVKSSKKEVNDISLVDTAQVFASGQLDITIGTKKSTVTTNPSIKNYMYGNSRELQVFHTSSSGKRYTGAVIEKSSVFLKDGFDTAGMGFSKNINKAVIVKMGLDPDMEDSHALGIFNRNCANYVANLQQDDNDVRKIDANVLFNPSWLAEEFSKTKNNKDLLVAFEKKYALLLRSTLVYMGTGIYSYALKLNTRNVSIPSVIYMNLSSMCERFVGYYNLYKTFYHKMTFSDALKSYCKYQNLQRVGELLQEALVYGISDIEFHVDMFGVKKKDEKELFAADEFNRLYQANQNNEEDDQLDDDAWDDKLLRKDEVPIDRRRVRNRDKEVQKNRNDIKDEKQDESHNEWGNYEEDFKQAQDVGKDNEEGGYVDNNKSNHDDSSGQRDDDTDVQVHTMINDMGKKWMDKDLTGLKPLDFLVHYFRAIMLEIGWHMVYPDEFCSDYQEDADCKGTLAKRCRYYVQTMLNEDIQESVFKEFEAKCKLPQTFLGVKLNR